VQPTGASRADLVPAVKEFHALVQAGISKDKLLLVLNHIATQTEELASQAYCQASGYQVAPLVIYERPSYRQAQNQGQSITQVNYASLRKQAQDLVKSLLTYLR
jgi:chromosome partitioning protein